MMLDIAARREGKRVAGRIALLCVGSHGSQFLEDVEGRMAGPLPRFGEDRKIGGDGALDRDEVGRVLKSR
jgi:hypothetical protein